MVLISLKLSAPQAKKMYDVISTVRKTSRGRICRFAEQNIHQQTESALHINSGILFLFSSFIQMSGGISDRTIFA